MLMDTETFPVRSLLGMQMPCSPHSPMNAIFEASKSLSSQSSQTSIWSSKERLGKKKKKPVNKSEMNLKEK